MAKINKKILEQELELAFDLKFSHEEGKDCFSALTLGMCEEWEHCGWCEQDTPSILILKGYEEGLICQKTIRKIYLCFIL